MRLLVTGAGGMLGSDLVRLARGRGHEVVALAHAALDVTDAEAVRSRLAAERPEAVLNCAAWTDVDGAEDHEQEARAVNGIAAGVLARAARETGARLVHVSSDYVFPGDDPRPRRELDRTEARSAYGRSKLQGERLVEAAGGEWLIVRSSWLYGRHGRNFVDTIRSKAEAGEPLRVVADQRGSPTWTVSLAGALLDLLAVRHAGIVHFANRGAATWHALAAAILEELGLDVPLTAITTAEAGRRARRPAHSVLDSGLFQKLTGRAPLEWREALRLHLRGAVDEPGVSGP